MLLEVMHSYNSDTLKAESTSGKITLFSTTIKRNTDWISNLSLLWVLLKLIDNWVFCLGSLWKYKEATFNVAQSHNAWHLRVNTSITNVIVWSPNNTYLIAIIKSFAENKDKVLTHAQNLTCLSEMMWQVQGYVPQEKHYSGSKLVRIMISTETRANWQKTAQFSSFLVLEVLK